MRSEHSPGSAYSVPSIPRRLGVVLAATAALGLTALAPSVNAEHPEMGSAPTGVDYDCSDLFPGEDVAKPMEGLPVAVAMSAGYGVFSGSEESGYCPDGEGNIAILYSPEITPGIPLANVQRVADEAEVVLRANGYNAVSVDVVIAPEYVVDLAEQQHRQVEITTLPIDPAMYPQNWPAAGGGDSDGDEGGRGCADNPAAGDGCFAGGSEETPAPVVVTQECVDADEVHGQSFSQVAIAHMPQLSPYRTVLGLDVASCDVRSDPDGNEFVAPGAWRGVSHTDSRAVDAYDITSEYQLLNVSIHELFHNLGYLGHTSSYRDNGLNLIEQLSQMGEIVPLEAIVRARFENRTGYWEEYDSKTGTKLGIGEVPQRYGENGQRLGLDVSKLESITTSVQQDQLSGSLWGLGGSVTANLDIVNDATLVPEWQKGKAGCSGAIVALENPIYFAQDGTDKVVAYTHFAFDITPGGIEVYVVSTDDLYGLTGIVHVGTLENGYTGKSRVVINDQMITFRTDFSETKANGDILVHMGAAPLEFAA